jgi:hypothetical protein
MHIPSNFFFFFGVCMYGKKQTQVADKIRPSVDKYEAAFPALLEIPSKDHPYGQHPPPLQP